MQVRVFEIIILFFVMMGFGSSFQRLPSVHQTRKRLPYLDILKGIAIICIVMIHASEAFSENVVLREFLWGALPLFVFASGYLLAYRYKTVVWRSYLLNIFKRIVIIYTLFVIIIGVFFEQSSLQTIILDFLLGRTNGNFYFIPLIIQLYILYPFLLKVRKYWSHPLFLTGIGMGSLYFHVQNYTLQQPVWNAHPLSLMFCGRYLIFFVIGLALSTKDLSAIRSGWLAMSTAFFVAIGGLLSLSVNHFYLGFLWPLGFLSLSLLIIKYLPVAGNHFLAALGKESLIIYLMHTRLVFNLFLPLPLPPTVLFLLSLVGGIIISYGLAKGLRLTAKLIIMRLKKSF